jgi:hypothetical protein
MAGHVRSHAALLAARPMLAAIWRRCSLGNRWPWCAALWRAAAVRCVGLGRDRADCRTLGEQLAAKQWPLRQAIRDALLDACLRS